MRFDAYIIQEGRTKPIDADTAIPWMKKKCGKYIKGLVSGKIPTIYRGIRNFTGEYGIVDPKSASERRSANTMNHTTLLVDNLPSWKRFPKRSQSIICSTNFANAQSYGPIHLVYPTDQCDIGVVPSMDMWDGFQKRMRSDIPVFNRLLNRVHDIPDTTWAEMKSKLIFAFNQKLVGEYKRAKGYWDESSFDIPWNKHSIKQTIEAMARNGATNGGVVNRMIQDFITKQLEAVEKGNKIDIIEFLSKEMAPFKNDFKLNSLKTSDLDNEVWIGNAPIFVVTLNQRTRLNQEGMTK